MPCNAPMTMICTVLPATCFMRCFPNSNVLCVCVASGNAAIMVTQPVMSPGDRNTSSAAKAQGMDEFTGSKMVPRCCKHPASTIQNRPLRTLCPDQWPSVDLNEAVAAIAELHVRHAKMDIPFMFSWLSMASTLHTSERGKICGANGIFDEIAGRCLDLTQRISVEKSPSDVCWFINPSN